MVQVRCPKCSNVVEGAAGQEAVCGNCGFRAILPATSGPSPEAAPATSNAPPAGPTTPSPDIAVLAIWGYILGVAGIATFFLARTGLPFAFGTAAIVLSIVAMQRQKKDRRAAIGLALGGIALAGGLVWLLVS